MDNLASTEIVVSYSVLARWFDPPAVPIEEKKSLSQIKQGKEKDLDKEPTNASISLGEWTFGGKVGDFWGG